MVITPLSLMSMKLAPFDSIHTELSIHAINLIIMSGPFSQGKSQLLVVGT